MAATDAINHLAPLPMPGGATQPPPQRAPALLAVSMTGGGIQFALFQVFPMDEGGVHVNLHFKHIEAMTSRSRLFMIGRRRSFHHVGHDRWKRGITARRITAGGAAFPLTKRESVSPPSFGAEKPAPRAGMAARQLLCADGLI